MQNIDTMRLIQQLVLLSILLLDNQVEVTWPKAANPLPYLRWTSNLRSISSTSPSSSSSSLLSLSTSFEEENCAECTQNKVGILTVTDPILTELRVEYVKQQILKKLRLSKPPEISMPLSTLPKPLINGRVLELQPGAPLEPEKSADSFYGKTDQIVVFPNEGQSLWNWTIRFTRRVYLYEIKARRKDRRKIHLILRLMNINFQATIYASWYFYNTTTK